MLRVSPGSTVADFCEHVDTRIREALQHQRFPVQALERKAHRRGPGQPADRVSVNFIPSIFTLDCQMISDRVSERGHSHPVFWRPVRATITVPEIRPVEPAIVDWTWTVPHTPSSTVALLVVVTSAQDPVNETRRVVADVARTNHHVALREFEVRMPVAPASWHLC